MREVETDLIRNLRVVNFNDPLEILASALKMGRDGESAIFRWRECIQTIVCSSVKCASVDKKTFFKGIYVDYTNYYFRIVVRFQQSAIITFLIHKINSRYKVQ